MHTPFGSVHAAALCTVAIVQQFTGQASKLCALGSLEYKGGYGSAILAEVDYECLTLAERNLLTGSVRPEGRSLVSIQERPLFDQLIAQPLFHFHPHQVAQLDA